MSTQISPQAIKDGYHRRLAAWREHGLSSRAAGALAIAGCDSIIQAASLGRDYFAKLPNVTAKNLQELSILAGWPPPRTTAVEAISAALLLAINDPDEAQEIALDVLIALRRSGFLVVAAK